MNRSQYKLKATERGGSEGMCVGQTEPTENIVFMLLAAARFLLWINHRDKRKRRTK